MAGLRFVWQAARTALAEYKTEIMEAQRRDAESLLRELNTIKEERRVDRSEFALLSARVSALELVQAETKGKADAILAMSGAGNFAEALFGTPKKAEEAIQ